jgi:uncharacterized protein
MPVIAMMWPPGHAIHGGMPGAKRGLEREVFASLTLFLCGGGASIRDVQQHLKAGMPRQIIERVSNRVLPCPNADECVLPPGFPEQDFHRVAVAYGLTFGSDFEPFVLPNAVHQVRIHRETLDISAISSLFFLLLRYIRKCVIVNPVSAGYWVSEQPESVMLIEFSVTNYLSIKDRATFSMVASTDNALEESNVITAGKHRLVRSAVLYGANASGKSNVLSALYCVRHMVMASSKDTQANEEIDVEPFLLSTACDDKPSAFEIVFLHDGMLYRYGFQVDRKRIHAEWLFSRPSTKEATLFEREASDIRVNADRFKEGKGLEARTRENALFLSVCAQFNGEVATSLLGWFQNLRMLQGFAPMGMLDVTLERLKEPGSKARVLELTQVADSGITDYDLRQKKLTLQDFPKEMSDEIKQDILKDHPMIVELKTAHRKFDEANNDVGAILFDLDDNESAGTQKMVKLTGPLLDALENGRLLVVDELDARMHPLLTRMIVSLFNSPTNQSKAQLIFASHDTTLLTPKLFRRDQVWFTEKDPYGATDLYSLVELKGVRKEATFAKDYIQGKYGAIPFIGDPKWLFREGSHE